MIFFFAFSNESDQDKFEYLYQRYKNLLLHKAYDILRDYTLAEDAVSEAYIRIYKNLHKIDDPDSGMTASFLSVIVKNTAINILNQNKNISASDIYEEEPPSDFDVEAHVISETVAEGMLDVVDQLKDELKECFLLMYAHDLSYKEIGALLKISESNVAVRIHRAKKKLIKLLKEGGYI